jgi:hypothetical protein
MGAAILFRMASSGGADAAGDRRTSVRRFAGAAVTAIVAASVPYLWVLWDLWTGTINVLRQNGSVNGSLYDVQARALLHGHLSLPNGKIGFLAFVHDGRQYTYFGLFPSLLRIPIFLFTHSFDGRLTALSISGAWVVTAVFSSLLLWRLRILLRGDAVLGWGEAVSSGVLLISILAGSVLVFLASDPDVYNEDLAWSVALACACFYALVGVVERPSWGRFIACGIAVLLASLSRPTTGYAAIFAALLIAFWFASGRAGSERRRWAVFMALVGLVPLAVTCVIDLMKFGVLFGVPYSDEVLFKYFQLKAVNGGHFLDLRFLPSTLQAYVAPTNFRLTSIFPYITLPDVPSSLSHNGRLFYASPTASVIVSMPLLVASSIVGVVAAFTSRRPMVFSALRILLVTAAIPAGVILIYGWILEHFVADFMPLLVLASMIGMIQVWRWLDRRSAGTRVSACGVLAVLAVFGLWTNLGLAITPTVNWKRTQLTRYVHVQKIFSDVTGHPLNHYIVVGSHFPSQAPTGTLFIRGRCKELYVADQKTPKTPPYDSLRLPYFWLLVERAPATPMCRSLLVGGVPDKTR